MRRRKRQDLQTVFNRACFANVFDPIRPHARQAFFFVLGCILLLGSLSHSAIAQQQYPDLRYYQGAAGYYEADYKDALRYFTRAARSAFQVGNRRFVDSVCYWTMMGECHYHVGNYAQAITLYEQALRLYLSHENENWQGRIQQQATIQQDNAALARARITWGTPTGIRGVVRGPDTFQVLFGKLQNERILQQGGVVQNPELKRVDVTEVMRCVALCLHRRRAIKGPIAKLDPLTAQLVSGLSQSRAGDGSLIGAYNGVITGIALAATEDWEAAAAILKRSVRSGGMDHPLTPIGLLESAYIAQSAKQDAVAGVLALEASYSAAVFDQFDLVEESLSLGATLHLKSNRSVYAPLVNTIEWARRNDARLLQASMIVRLAECHSESGNPAASAAVLANAGQAIRPRNSLSGAVVSARLKYVTALNQFLTGNFNAGMTSLAAALQHFQNGSLWQYRLGLTESLLASGALNALQADQLYSLLLGDPTEELWLTAPFETIAFLVTPHTASIERWFEIVVKRRDFRRAVEISELLRRHRFFASLPLGGRLMGFRWQLEAPEMALTKSALRKRAEFMNANVVYRKSSEEIKLISQQLAGMDMFPEAKSDEERQLNTLLKKLQTISAAQENLLASNALRRIPSDLSFPPAQRLNDLRNTLREDQAVYLTVATFNGYHQMLVTKGTVRYLGFSGIRNVHRAVATWLRQLGVNEQAVDFAKLNEDDWKKSSREMVKLLFPDSKAEDWEAINELLIIPDGAFWYLPFEALLIKDQDDNERFLSEAVHVRYAPTLALGIGAQRKTKDLEKLAVVTAQLHPRTDAELSGEAFAELKLEMPDAQRVESIRKPINAFTAFVDSILVWSQIRPVRGAPYNLAPMQLGTEKSAGTLGAMMTLPWRGPQQIVMPTYQAEGITMRGKIVGSEMFLTTTAMMASGARSILISRWSTGGQTSLDLTRQFVQKQKPEGVAKALANSRKAVRESVLNPDVEPRLRFKASDPESKAAHPFFWASHMLIEIPDERSASVVPIIDPGKSDEEEEKKVVPAAGGNMQPDNMQPQNKDADNDKGKNMPAKGNPAASDKALPGTKPASAGGVEAKQTEPQASETKDKPAKKSGSGVGWQPRPPKKSDGKSGGS